MLEYGDIIAVIVFLFGFFWVFDETEMSYAIPTASRETFLNRFINAIVHAPYLQRAWIAIILFLEQGPCPVFSGGCGIVTFNVQTEIRGGIPAVLLTGKPENSHTP